MQKTHVADPASFLLGSAYPDRFHHSVEEGLALHYKKDLMGPCDLTAFLKNEERDDFGLGYFFHLWVDDRIMSVNTEDISPSDCLICDMGAFLPFYETLRGQTFTGKKQVAMQNVLTLEREPMPLYLVPPEKKKRYEVLLDTLVDEFLEAYPLKNSLQDEK